MDGGGTAGVPGIPGISGLAELGSTPAAHTYRGTDAGGRPVVVKVLRRDADEGVRARFDYDQARLAELVDHPDVVTTLAHGYTDDNRPYLVAAELPGGSLADRVGSGMDGPGVLSIGVKIAGALESAHRRNLVHGDLRPEDILIDRNGEPQITDLGVALVTGWGPDRATEPARVAHAAPEQFETHLPTQATDVYALGSVLYALLAGSPAFVRPGDASPTAVALRIANDRPADLRATGVPAPVVDVIERAMAKAPGQRWESAEAMGHALQQAEVTLGLPITPMTVVGAEVNPPRPAETDDGRPDVAPSTAKAAGTGSKAPLLIGAGVLVLVAAVAGFLLLGGDDGGGDDPGGGGPFERNGGEDIDLVAVSDDTDAITVEVLERWEQEVDGQPFFDDGTITVPDVVASEEEGFFGDGGFDISGIEVTAFGADAVASLTFGEEDQPFPTDPEGILEQRVQARSLDQECTTDLPPADEEVAGFDGLLQRFEGCSGSALVVFAGVDDAGGALVVEAHLVEDEDEAAIEQILDSISVTR